ncbi:SDR family NAD(P)-dependent oxidoreductase [Paenibacillus sp. Soil522]|uniref:SDR family NAD(P)-dependent oxidoreductase n=1 Tax=Paenibacillus sp. Soil522 TaxID=1736388 RepID=UPI0006F5ABF1|nr:SDR family oxidoreductase [Paenibacillus sp. Soil522]KRE46297.1 short-chain dehydrogenase [Paenibacillus sp. Soil522]
MNSYYKSMFELNGKTAIVTGGLGILGKRICSGLAEFGANVAVIDLDEKAASSFADELTKSYGTVCIGLGGDIASLDEVIRMVETIFIRFGSIDILLNNAASKSSDLNSFFAPFEQYTLEQWRKIMSVNIDAMFLMAQAVGKYMIQQKTGGSIIQTASIHGMLGADHRIYEGSSFMGRPINSPAVYSASKAAVYGLTKYLATYWAGQGIRVNAVTPGGIESGHNDTFQKKYAARTPLGRMGRPDEVVGAYIFLASDASSYVTGQNIIIDGGLSAW